MQYIHVFPMYPKKYIIYCPLNASIVKGWFRWKKSTVKEWKLGCVSHVISNLKGLSLGHRDYPPSLLYHLWTIRVREPHHFKPKRHWAERGVNLCCIQKHRTMIRSYNGQVLRLFNYWENWRRLEKDLQSGITEIRLFLDRLTKPLPRREMICKLFKQTYAMKRMYVVNNKLGSN